jgi:hypothetical protein
MSEASDSRAAPSQFVTKLHQIITQAARDGSAEWCPEGFRILRPKDVWLLLEKGFSGA